MKKCIFLLFFFQCSLFVYGQPKELLQLADGYFNQYEYAKALTVYEKLVQNNPSNAHCISQLAECYRHTGNTSVSEDWYKKLAGMENVDPIFLYNYAEVLNANQKYKEAHKYYELYKAKKPSDSRVANKLNTIKFLHTFYKDSSFYRVANLSINSDKSDFGFFPYGGDRYIFASNRESEDRYKDTYEKNKQTYLSLYRVNRNTDGTFEPIQPIWDNLISSYNVGPASFDLANSSFYITTNNNYKNKSASGKLKENKLKIFTAHYDGYSINGIFDFQYNNNEYSVGHAVVSNDDQHLYFVSDMPGGFGGTDIYVCNKVGNNWGEPKNLGNKINTEGNEMFPYIADNNTLYFSSDGFSGLGGLDIYAVSMDSNITHSPKNMGYPINSSGDDFSFYISSNGKSGFFSSNRPGGKGSDDIYSFTLIKPLKAEIHGIVRSEEFNIPVDEAKVVLQGFDGKSQTQITDAQGGFYFEVNWDMDYALTVSKEKYIITKKIISTSETKIPFEVEVKIKRSDYNLEAHILSKSAKDGIAGATISISSGNNSQSLVSDDHGNFSVGLEAANVYVISIVKPNYMTKTYVVSTIDLNPGTINKTFYLEPFKVGDIFEIKTINYSLSKSNIEDDSKPELDKLVTMLNENPTLEIEVGSHTDSRGDDEENMVLSQQCAKAAATYIVSKGIAPNRVVGKGYGETMPLNNCINGAKCSDAEFEINKRTEIKVLKI